MPVFLASRDKHNVTNGHDLLFFLSGHDALSHSDYQDLFIIMGMKFISDTFPEIYYVHFIFFAFWQQYLPCHLSTSKDGIGKNFFGNLIHINYLHLILIPTL